MARAKAGPSNTSASKGYTIAIVDELIFVDGYAELKALLRKVGRAENHATYYADQSRGRHHWTYDELTSTQRSNVSSSGKRRKTMGGSPGVTAQRHVLVQMVTD